MKLPRPTVSGILAMLALLVATSGSAYAATTLAKNSVGSKQIKNNTVRSVDIRDGQVGFRDLGPGVLAALEDDPSTAPLEPSPPVAYEESTSNIQFIGADWADFGTLTVQEAGDYLVTASLRVFPRAGVGGDRLYCNITAPTGNPISLVNNGVDMPKGVAEVTMHGVMENLIAGDDMTLRCMAGEGEITMTYDWTAVQVSLN